MNFSAYLQENLMTLLVYDKERSKIIRGTVEAQLFGGTYKEIISRTYDYIDRHKEPPGDHIADLLEDKLESDNKRERRLYRDIISSLHESRESINYEYVMNRLEEFVKRQSLRSIAVELAKELQRDTEDSLEKAESLIRQANTTSLKVFDPGLRLSDTSRSLNFLDIEDSSFPIGIPEFDRRGFGPTRKEMFLYIADTKTGKTWCMVNLARSAMVLGIRVVHITLEMSEDKVAQRYMQAMFSISKRDEEFIVRRFMRDKEKQFKEIKTDTLKPKMHFGHKRIRPYLRKRLKHWMFNNVIIKQFPTGKLTVNELEAYLDNLEITEKFVPDIIIVDYPDLMRLPNTAGGQYRHGLAEVYKGLRGLAVSRNAAMACPTQSNRAGASAKTVGRTNVSEAYAKIADADTAVTYSQTKFEKELGLARLSVVAGRNDEDNITVVLSQSYNIGQFALDSVMMNKKYWETLNIEESDAEADEDYDDDD